MSSTQLGRESWPELQSQVGPHSHFLLGQGEGLEFHFLPPLLPPLESCAASTPQAGTGSQPAVVMQMPLSPALECGNPPSPTNGTKALRVAREAPQ